MCCPLRGCLVDVKLCNVQNLMFYDKFHTMGIIHQKGAQKQTLFFSVVGLTFITTQRTQS